MCDEPVIGVARSLAPITGPPLIEEHGAEPERAAAQSTATNALMLLRQAREGLGQGLRAIEADSIAESDEISLRNH